MACNAWYFIKPKQTKAKTFAYIKRRLSHNKGKKKKKAKRKKNADWKSKENTKKKKKTLKNK